jgi:hypothetical protein
MKTRFRVLLVSIFVLGIAIVYSTSCKKAVEAALYNCADVGNLCGTGMIRTCVNNAGSGYYEWNGNKYNFTATTITDAATAVTNAACAKKAPQESIETVNQIVDYTNILIKSLPADN